ncbi:MAG TPA: DUF3108 domain-containing protein [Bryobacteraceae bacterium]|nr:DUF3108 domain-containing protein [Bryobacteraceae bacterium]
MSKRAVFWGVPLGLLVMLVAVAGSWQKPSDPAPAKGSPTPQANGFPSTGESLNYTLIWPGGASLGEAHLRASKGEHGWTFDFSLDASVPGFSVSDHYHSRANSGLCSLELEKVTVHGQRHTHEKTVFDYKEGKATRTTLVEGGGHTDIDVDDCAHDGLDYVFYARHELAEGHGVPKEQDVLFGASYSTRMEYAGVQDVTVGGKRYQADHVFVYLKGPASDYKVEIFFARDPARTPLIIKAPLPVGTLSMELVR